MKVWESQNSKTVLACSALKQSYRDQLAQAAPVEWVYLKGDADLIRQRLANRQGHFVSGSLLDSQFEALEESKKGFGPRYLRKPRIPYFQPFRPFPRLTHPISF